MVDRPLIMSRQEMAVGSDSAPSEGDPSARDDEALLKLTGTVKWFDATRGFGFMVSEGAKGDIRALRIVVLVAGLSLVAIGWRLELLRRRVDEQHV